MGERVKGFGLRKDEAQKPIVPKKVRIGDETSSQKSEASKNDPKKSPKLYDLKSISASDLTSTSKKKDQPSSKKQEAKPQDKSKEPEKETVKKESEKDSELIRGPTKTELFDLLQTMQNELCDIRARQLFTLQNLGMVKADLVKVKEAVNRSKWFTDALVEGLCNMEAQEDCIKCDEPSTLELLKNSIPSDLFDDEDSNTLSAIALYDYQAGDIDEISFDTNDIISEIEMIDEGWWLGCINGKRGLFPANYVILQ